MEAFKMTKETPDEIETVIKACEAVGVVPELDLFVDTPSLAKALEIIKENTKNE